MAEFHLNLRRTHYEPDTSRQRRDTKLSTPAPLTANGAEFDGPVSAVETGTASLMIAACNSAKAGVRHLSKSVALDGARTARKGGPLVRCNSIHPMFIDTPILVPMVGASPEVREKLDRLVPVGPGIGESIDVAHAALYLASDESRFVTGTEPRIKGGISAM